MPHEMNADANYEAHNNLLVGTRKNRAPHSSTLVDVHSTGRAKYASSVYQLLKEPKA